MTQFKALKDGEVQVFEMEDLGLFSEDDTFRSRYSQNGELIGIVSTPYSLDAFNQRWENEIAFLAKFGITEIDLR